MANAPLTGRQKIVRLLRDAFAGIVAVVAVAYLLDYAVLRYRIAANKTPFGTVTVRPLYVVPQKNHRVEYMPSDPVDQTCANSLFPHAGNAPCWYLRSHPERQIDM